VELDSRERFRFATGVRIATELGTVTRLRVAEASNFQEKLLRVFDRDFFTHSVCYFRIQAWSDIASYGKMKKEERNPGRVTGGICLRPARLNSKDQQAKGIEASRRG